MTTTGHSDRRTPAKHAFLDKQLGRFIGAVPYVARKLGTAFNRVVIVDLTAGDGIAYHDEGAWERACSPGIFARHGRFRLPVKTDVVLYERAVGTYDSLLANLDANLRPLGYDEIDGHSTWAADDHRVALAAFNDDGRNSTFSTAARGDWVFINNDPNKVHDWALNPDALRAAVDRGANVLSFSTLGCNPGGLKRMPFEGGRDAWYGHLNGALSALGPTQDAVLFAIDGDDAQWAYLAITPRKWAMRDLTTASKVFGQFGMTVSCAQFRTERQQFADLVHRLFLTAKERGE